MRETDGSAYFSRPLVPRLLGFCKALGAAEQVASWESVVCHIVRFFSMFGSWYVGANHSNIQVSADLQGCQTAHCWSWSGASAQALGKERGEVREG